MEPKSETTQTVATADRSGCSTAPLGSAFPDIGDDPLQVPDQDDKIEAARRRLSAGVGLQQSRVPDQTMLAWRIDVSRLMDDHTWRRASMETAWRVVQELKDHIEEIRQIASGENPGCDDEDAEDALVQIDEICKRAIGKQNSVLSDGSGGKKDANGLDKTT